MTQKAVTLKVPTVFRLAVSEVRLALPNFYNIAIRIANVAARLAVFVLWLCDKLGSSASPIIYSRLEYRQRGHS